MKPVISFYDKVTDKAIELNKGIADRMIEFVPQLPGQVKLTQREQLERYLRMTQADLDAMIQQRGEAATNYYIASMMKLRQKYGGL